MKILIWFGFFAVYEGLQKLKTNTQALEGNTKEIINVQERASLFMAEVVKSNIMTNVLVYTTAYDENCLSIELLHFLPISGFFQTSFSPQM